MILSLDDAVFAGSSGPSLLSSGVTGLGGGRDEGQQVPQQVWSWGPVMGTPVLIGAPSSRVTKQGSQLYL